MLLAYSRISTFALMFLSNAFVSVSTVSCKAADGLILIGNPFAKRPNAWVQAAVSYATTLPPTSFKGLNS